MRIRIDIGKLVIRGCGTERQGLLDRLRGELKQRFSAPGAASQLARPDVAAQIARDAVSAAASRGAKP